MILQWLHHDLCRFIRGSRCCNSATPIISGLIKITNEMQNIFPVGPGIRKLTYYNYYKLTGRDACRAPFDNQ